ncbi:MAG: hypothetical protein H7831_14700 [Magnetococcus sp. WYHC-3]
MATVNSKKHKPLDLKAFVIATLRRASYRWPPREEAFRRARAGQLRVRGRLVWHHHCAMCPKDKWYTRKQVKADHIEPVVSTKDGFIGWDVYIPRMLCPVEGFQILCEQHHSEKTKKEQLERKLAKLTPEQAYAYLEKIKKKLAKKKIS